MEIFRGKKIQHMAGCFVVVVVCFALFVFSLGENNKGNSV